MRACAAIALVLAAVAVGGCGGGDDESSPPISSRSKPPSAQGVRATVQGYMQALRRGDGKQACRFLDDRGQAGVVALLPSNEQSLACDKAVARVSRQAVAFRDFTIEDVKVLGRSASATVKSTNPPFSSGVLLSHEGDSWKISFPPGLLEQSSPPPGVPLEQD